jgi:hypothetical protein
MEIIASFHFTRDSGEGQGKERSDPMNKLQVIEYQNQRVLTTAQLAEAFGAESDRISKNFSENRDRYTEGKHFLDWKASRFCTSEIRNRNWKYRI